MWRMQGQERQIKQDISLQGRRSTVVNIASKLEGVEGGLRMDMFDHDDPEDAPCICDLPEPMQDIIWSDINAEEQ